MKVSYKYTVLFIFLFANFSLFATKYTWTGNTSTDWSTSTNWSPNGVPSTTDSVKIVTRTNAPVVGANTTVKDLDMTSGSISLGGYSLTVSNNAYFYAGTLSNGTLVLRGSYALFNGSTFNVTIDAIAARTEFSGGVFNYPCSFEQTGTSTTNGAGGCTFNAAVTIKKSGASYLTMGVTSADIFNSKLKVINTGTYAIQLGYNTVSAFYDSLIFENSSASGISIGGGNTNGGGHIYNGKKIAIGTGGFSAGLLTLKNFIQTGTGQQAFATSGSAITSLAGCSFEADLTITSPGILLKTSTFNGTTEFIRSSTSSSYSDGGNTFNGTTTFRNNASNTASFRLGVQTGDQYNGNVSFITSTGYIQPAFAGTSEFKGNVSISSSMVVFNAGAGKMLCTGTNNQTFSTSGSLTYLVSKFGVNKSSGTVTFNAPITVDSLLELTSGNIITSSSNLLTLKATATVSGGSSMSFVNGPLKKNGSAAFLYPVGKVNEYNPISLSTGNNVTDSYLVEYFNQGQSLSNNKDTTIKEINSKMYWSCTRISGTSIPSISLFWNEKNSIFAKPSNSKVVAWNNVKWKDKGQTNSSGNALIGSITALFDVTANYYTVGRVNDTTQISEQRLLKDVAVLGLDSINVQMPMQILGSAVSMVYCSNLYATDTIGSQNTLIDSVRNEFVDVFATYKSKTYTSIVVNEGDTISNQGFFKLGKCTYNLGFTISGDTSMKVILKCDSLFKLNNGAKIKLNGIKRSNVIWICEDVSVDSLSEMNGVVFCRTFNSKTYNLGHIQLLSSGKVELNNSIGLNDYVFLRNGVELDRINQNLSLLTTPCNFITNGDLEGGVPTSSIVSLAGITNGYCQNWLSLSSSSAPCATRPDNTPDYFDRNIANSSFNNCYLNVGTGVGIPNNYQSDGVVNVRTPNQNRYMMMLEKEAAANQLASTLRNKIYALSFFYAGSNCLGNTDAACIYLTNLNNNKVQVGNYNYNLGSGTSSSGDWRQAFICVDLHQISNLQQYSHIAFRGNQFTSNLFYDDFALIEIADAGDDKTICSNQSVTIGGNSCPNSIIPNTITTFSWTASPAYNWQNGENLTAQPSVSPSISTLFTLTTTITFTDPLDPSNVTTCSDFDQVFVEVLNLSGSISVNQNPCNAATLLAAATSGTAPFSYQWNTGSTSNSITVSSNGVYTVTISDASGCSTVLTQNVQLSNLATNVTIVNSPCVGQSNGQISVVMQGGVSGYSYSWSNGSVSGSGNSSQATWNITGLNVGNYTLLITDVSGCSASVTFQVVEVPCCSLSVSLIPQQPCSTNQSGAINGALVNGNGPFTVSWQQTPTGLSGSLVTSSSSFTIPNLVPGTYSVQIVDANSCTASGSSTISIISPPSIPVVIGSNSICNSTSSYSISNPATGVAYTWSFVPSYSNAGATLTFSNTTGNATNVTYNDNSNYMLSVVATNANGCTASTFFAVNECCNDGELNVVDGSSSTIPSYYNNFSIDGVFSVDVNTVWNSKTIYMGPGAEIRIQPGKSLTIESSNIIPCRTFWKSITVNYGSLITIDNSIVQGGQYAIDVRAGGGYVIQNNSNLYDNFVSLRVTGPPSSMPRKIEKTNICRAPSGLSLYNSLADFIGQTPSTGNSSTCVARPYAGIVLDFANVNLVGTLMPNRLIVIKDAMYGIWSSNSFLRVLQTHI